MLTRWLTDWRCRELAEVVCIGEPMLQLNAVTRGPLRYVTYFERHVAGAEANVAVAVAKLGHTSALVARVGEDEFGWCIYNFLRGEGVDVRWVKFDPDAPTAVYFIQRGYPDPWSSRVVYYRKGSAGSRLSPDDMQAESLKGAKFIHVTGITPAISDTAREAVKKAVLLAKDLGIKVSFDTNIRPQLWRSTNEASSVLRWFLERADLVFTDTKDADILIGESDPKSIIDKLLVSFEAELVVLKLGAEGAIAVTDNNRVRVKAPQMPVEDPIGAGDALAGAMLASLLDGLDVEEALKRAVIAGSLAVTTRGDVESQPDIKAIKELWSIYNL